jgi:acyl-CoA thioester hydrolase
MSVSEPVISEPIESGGPPHRLDLRVYYEDTDFSGFVYHASYLRFMERGRTELLRALAGDQSDLHREARGLVFVVRRMSLDFLRPARMDDQLAILTRTRALRGASMQLAQEVRRDDELLVAADVTVACVRDGRAVRLPDTLRRRLASADGV